MKIFELLKKSKSSAAEISEAITEAERSLVDGESRVNDLEEARRRALLADDRKEMATVESALAETNLLLERTTLAIREIKGRLAA